MSEQPQTPNDVTKRPPSDFRQPCPPDGKLLCWVCGTIKNEDEFPRSEIAGHTVCADCLEDGDRLYDLVGMLEVEMEYYDTAAGKVRVALEVYGAWLAAHAAARLGPWI
jgi:hypothetical protein